MKKERIKKNRMPEGRGLSRVEHA